MFSPVTALGCLLRFSNERAVLFSHRMLLFLYIYLYHIVSVLSYDAGLLRNVFSVRKNLEKPFFDERGTPLQCLLDAIMMLTFFDAVVIAIRTCCYRDDNMMLST